MPGTTTLKLSRELKGRIALAAQQTGKTAHALVADALLAREEVAR
jgi:predicted transcriptional regulator